MPLTVQEIRATAPTPGASRVVWFLHGFMGRGQNWTTFARRLCEARPDLSCVLLDLRLHGDSRDLPPPHTLAACVDDLRVLARARGAGPDVLVGHSFGGRVVLAYAPEHAGQAWVLDAAPASRGDRDDTSTGRVLRALGALPESFTDRRAFTEGLIERGVGRGVAMWLAKNLEREGDGLRFALDLPALEGLLADHDRVSCWPVVEDPPATLDVRFVLAGRDSVLATEDRQRLEALAAQGIVRVSVLPEAGHWLHVDDPDGLLQRLVADIPV